MRNLVLFLLLASCGPGGPTPLFVTGCGMGFYGVWPTQADAGWDQATTSHYESKLIDIYVWYVNDPRFKDADKICSKFKGWQLWVSDQKTWVQNGETVGGSTACDYAVSQLGNEPITKGSYAHELAHLVQHCDPQLPINNNDVYHSNWLRDGIYHAIDVFQGL